MVFQLSLFIACKGTETNIFIATYYEIMADFIIKDLIFGNLTNQIGILMEIQLLYIIIHRNLENTSEIGTKEYEENNSFLIGFLSLSLLKMLLCSIYLSSLIFVSLYFQHVFHLTPWKEQRTWRYIPSIPKKPNILDIMFVLLQLHKPCRFLC